MARYIDADKLREYWIENGVNENVYNTNNVLDSIDYQTTTNVEEVRHGEWLKKPQRQKVNGSIIHRPCLVCSICERKHFALVSYNYCPNCGAKMDGEKPVNYGSSKNE